MKTGVVIVAAGMSTRMQEFKPLMKIENIAIAEYVVNNFQRAGVDNIVMVTGYRGAQLKKSLDYLHIEFVDNENYENTEMFESAKLGLKYLENRCDRVMFCPVDIPFVSDRTVKAVLNSESDIAIPTCCGQSGHPISISGKLIPSILAFDGKRGLKGAIEASGGAIEYIEVNDQGTLMDADTKEEYQRLVNFYNEHLM